MVPTNQQTEELETWNTKNKISSAKENKNDDIIDLFP